MLIQASQVQPSAPENNLGMVFLLSMGRTVRLQRLLNILAKIVSHLFFRFSEAQERVQVLKPRRKRKKNKRPFDESNLQTIYQITVYNI